MNMENLIALLFLARELAHRAHLRVNGPGMYAARMALGDFYEGIVGHADAIAEAYQGQFDVLLGIPLLWESLSADRNADLRAVVPSANTHTHTHTHLGW